MGGKRQEKFYNLCQIYKNISYRYDKFNITRLYIPQICYICTDKSQFITIKNHLT